MNDQDSKPPLNFNFDMRWVRWGGSILSSALFIWLLTRQDWPTMFKTLAGIPWWLFVVVFTLYFAAVLANTLRWFVLLRSQVIDISYGEVLKVVLSGNFASNFLPSTVGGDTVRIVSAARFAGWSVSFASVVVDRLLNMFVMATLLPFSWLSFKGLGGLSLAAWNHDGSPFWGAVLPLGRKLLDKIKSWLKKIHSAFQVWRDKKGAVLWALLISYGARLFVFTAVWLLASGLDIPVTLFQVIGVGAITYVLALLPISINGFGLREVSMTTLYVQLGATLEQASALVVITRFILMIETLPGAFWISDALEAAEARRKSAVSVES